jgi:hypothetical protein
VVPDQALDQLEVMVAEAAPEQPQEELADLVLAEELVVPPHPLPAPLAKAV